MEAGIKFNVAHLKPTAAGDVVAVHSGDDVTEIDVRRSPSLSAYDATRHSNQVGVQRNPQEVRTRDCTKEYS
jgi:hypothetical protein